MQKTRRLISLKMICALSVLLIAGCGSPPKSVVIAVPCQEKPKVPASLVTPNKYDFPKLLNDAFETSQKPLKE